MMPRLGSASGPWNFLEPWGPRNGPLHRLDARAKLLGLGLFLGAVALTPGGHWLRHGLHGMLLVGLLGLSRVPVGFFLRRLLGLGPFFLFAAAGLLWGASPTLFASFVVKSVLALVGITVLLATTPFPQLLVGLRGLRCPMVPLQVLAFAYRYLLLLMDQGMRMARAYTARAVGPRGFRQIRPLGGLLGHFFLRTYDRSERIYQAMLARGFDGRFRSLAPPRWGWTETVCLIGFALLLGGLGWF
jgi:cobalt/nickel transport system permease protein